MQGGLGETDAKCCSWVVGSGGVCEAVQAGKWWRALTGYEERVAL